MKFDCRNYKITYIDVVTKKQIDTYISKVDKARIMFDNPEQENYFNMLQQFYKIKENGINKVNEISFVKL
jgi:hypothetical protein